MSDKKISDLVELTTLAADDVLPVVDASANATKRVTYDTLATEVRTESEPLSATTVTAAGDITSNGETVYHRGNVVGTVSQSGGTPTGAVVERDSNANGEYTKFADGTMICFKGLLEIEAPGSPTNITRKDSFEWTFPVPFVSVPGTSVNLNSGFWRRDNFLDSNSSNSGSFMVSFDDGFTSGFRTFKVRVVYHFRSYRGAVDASLLAIGRWY